MAGTSPDLGRFREELVELLEGGFAPNIVLFKEFPFRKAGVLLEGLHFSAWVLLGHIKARQLVLLNFMKDPEKYLDVWPEAFWPENNRPETKMEWEDAIAAYGKELEEMLNIIKDPGTDLLKLHGNGKTISWAAMTTMHHTGYHVGQLKTIGRQLGVW